MDLHVWVSLCIFQYKIVYIDGVIVMKCSVLRFLYRALELYDLRVVVG